MKSLPKLSQLEKRIEQLENQIENNKPFRSHLILVKPGSTFEDELEEYKKKHDVRPDDGFTIFEFIDPKTGGINDTK